jgi:RNA polymerase sigma factor (sigma-70 family)
LTSDEDLMLQFQNGSREAFEELFARYRQPLYRFFRRRVPNEARADDLMQETFLAVIRARVRYEPRSLVRTYLYGIALKQVSAERRWQSRRPDSPLSDQKAGALQQSDTPIWIKQALTKLEEMDLNNARHTEQRLTQILATRTGKLSEVLEAEQKLAEVRGQIEQAEAEQKSLNNRISVATISLQVSEDYRAPLTGTTAPSVGTATPR